MGRWDHILDQKPQDLKQYVLGKVADQLVEDLRNFPPPIAEWLDADDLYYLGFHFAEHAGTMGEFGGKVLKLLLKRFPKNKLAASAKNKLKSSGER